ncbi:MAG: hypothetical protein PWQ37_1280 [Candidatus Petromonas sp.]|nr:hypothetical protein [Candidatus Petromonas sp.]
MAVIYKKKHFHDLKKTVANDSNPKDQGVSVITPTNRPDNIKALLNNYLRQNYNKKELIIVLNNDKMDIKKYKQKVSEYKNIKVFQINEKTTLGDCRNYAIEKSNLDYIAIFDDDDFYAPNYLNESIKTFYKINTDVVGKASFFTYFEKSKILALYHHLRGINKENQYVGHVADSSLVFRRNVLEKIGKYPSNQRDPDVRFQDLCSYHGFKIYSTHRFNYVLHRHNNPKLQHTWQAEEEEILRDCEIVEKNVTNYLKYVIL